MLRGVLLLVTLAGCRQILGIEPGGLAQDGAVADSVPAQDTGDRTERKKIISLSLTGPVGNLTGFPMWFVTDDPQIAARARADGSDIHFRTVFSSQIVPYEIQRWDPTTGHLEAWVLVSGGFGASVELHYGERDTPIAPATSPFTAARNFAAVWHLDDAFTSSTIEDATGATPGTATGIAAADRASAQLGAGLHLSATAQRVQFTNPITGSGSHTISAWVKLDAPMSYDPLIVLGSPATGAARFFHVRYASFGVLAAGFYGNDQVSTTTIAPGVWKLVHWVFDGPSRTSTLYVDGALAETYQHGMGISTTGTDGYLGYAPIAFGPSSMVTGMNGTIDEVRIQTAARTETWIAAEYANQATPAQTYSIGPEQMP